MLTITGFRWMTTGQVMKVYFICRMNTFVVLHLYKKKNTHKSKDSGLNRFFSFRFLPPDTRASQRGTSQSAEALSLPPLSSDSVSCFLCYSYWGGNVTVAFAGCQSAGSGVRKRLERVDLTSSRPGSDRGTRSALAATVSHSHASCRSAPPLEISRRGF